MTERGWCNAQLTPGRERADLVPVPVGDKDMGCVVRSLVEQSGWGSSSWLWQVGFL